MGRSWLTPGTNLITGLSGGIEDARNSTRELISLRLKQYNELPVKKAKQICFDFLLRIALTLQ